MLSYNCPDCSNKTLGNYIINSEYDYCLDCKKTDNLEFNFVCNKCGKEEKIKKQNYAETNFWHAGSFGEGYYGSKMDGFSLKFILCDDCLYEFVKSFKVELTEGL